MSQAETKSNENPFLNGLEVKDLVDNLAGDLLDRTKGMEPDRLRAIAHQADALRGAALINLRNLGRVIATAADGGQLLEESNLTHMGFLVEFLAGFAEFCDDCEGAALNRLTKGGAQ
jgi:hypothetical protein